MESGSETWTDFGKLDERELSSHRMSVESGAEDQCSTAGCRQQNKKEEIPWYLVRRMVIVKGPSVQLWGRECRGQNRKFKVSGAGQRTPEWAGLVETVELRNRHGN